MKITHKFLKNIPENVEKGILYISVEYSTAIHSCCCGCGNQVVTPFSPVDWKLTYDGETVSLYPSIGNWGFPCKSHYWIKNGEVLWDKKWNNDQITDVRKKDVLDKDKYFLQRKKKGFIRKLFNR